MINRELIMYDGTVIIPQYLNTEDRVALRNRFGEKREFMWCGCRNDVKMYYRVSTDGRIYPEKHGYSHLPGCILSPDNDERNTRAFVPSADGTASAYLGFDPATFTMPTDKDIDPPMSDGTEKEKDEDRSLRLSAFIRQLTVDTFNARMAEGKSMLSKEYFSSSLFSRLKLITIDRLRKPIREYTLNDDGFSFFYTAVQRIEEKGEEGKKSCSLVIKDKDGKEFRWFIYEKTLQVAKKNFLRRYGVEPKDAGDEIMMAGFRYQRRKKDDSGTYNVVGRLDFFLTSKNGIYARTKVEKANLDLIGDLLWKNKNLKFLLSDEGDSSLGYFLKTGSYEKYIITSPEDESINGNNIIRTQYLIEKIKEDEIKNIFHII